MKQYEVIIDTLRSGVDDITVTEYCQIAIEVNECIIKRVGIVEYNKGQPQIQYNAGEIDEN